MKQELKAVTQYGDFKGQIMCDGFDGPFLNELWNELNMPNGYFPIAIKFIVIRKEDQKFFEKLRIIFYACDTKEYGGSIEDIQKIANERGELIVKEFEIEKENLEKILEKIKRLSIIAIIKPLGDAKIYVSEK